MCSAYTRVMACLSGASLSEEACQDLAVARLTPLRKPGPGAKIRPLAVVSVWRRLSTAAAVSQHAATL